MPVTEARPGVRSAGCETPSCTPRDDSPSPCGTMISAASAGVMAGYSALMIPAARMPPRICAPMKGSTETGAMPAKVSENIRPTVMAGFAKLVDEVNQYAAPM